MRYDANHKERTRALLLAEAAAAIRSEGPDRVAVSRIMAAAGLTHGGFYAHFPSKDDLIAQAVTYMFDAAYSVFLSATEGRTPADALANYIDVYLSPSKRDDRAHGCPFAALGGDSPNFPEGARACFEEGITRIVEGIRRLIEQLGAKDAEALAYSTLAELTGALTLARAQTNPTRSATTLRISRRSAKRRLGLDSRR